MLLTSWLATILSRLRADWARSGQSRRLRGNHETQSRQASAPSSLGYRGTRRDLRSLFYHTFTIAPRWTNDSRRFLQRTWKTSDIALMNERLEDRTLLATYVGGDYGGANLALVNGDVLSGSSGAFTNVGTLTIPSGATVTVSPGFVLDVSAQDISIDGVLDGTSAGYSGGTNGGAAASNGTPGAGPGGGQGGAYGSAVHASGGAGGGYGGTGGNSGSAFGNSPPPAIGGSIYGSFNSPGALPGSGGGGAGNHSGLPGTGGAGGRGGGAISLYAVTITVSATGVILVDGQAGQPGIPNGDSYSVSSGGGGSGGTIDLNGLLSLNGQLSAKGGNGANYVDGTSLSNGWGQGGGGGGGGRIKLFGQLLSTSSYTTSVSGGTAGSSDPRNNAAPATAGQPGTIGDLTTVVSPAPTVNLSVSATNGTEVGTTSITVTATAAASVSGDQTVDLVVTGTGITGGDYTLSNTTITILSGQSVGSVTFTVKDDLLNEGDETATLTISNPSSGITLGTTLTEDITITDDDNAGTSHYGLPAAGAYRIVRNGSDIEIRDSGNMLIGSRPIGTDALVINGTSGNDTLTVDLAGGNMTLPVTFNGGTGSNDKLAIRGTDGEVVVYTPDAVTNGSGKIDIDNLIVTFTGLEPVDFDNVGTFTLSLPGGDDVVDITNGFNSTQTGAMEAAGTVPALVFTGTSGGVAFEAAHVFRTTNVAVNTTLVSDGDDSITVTSGNNAHGNTNLSIITGSSTVTPDSVSVNGDLTVAGTLTILTESLTVSALADAESTGANVVLTVEDISLLGTITASGVGGRINLSTAGTHSMELGTLGNAGVNTVELSDPELDNLTASVLQLVSNGTTLTLTGPISPAGTATLYLSAYTIVDGNAANPDITETNLKLEALGGIGTSVNPLETDVDNLSAKEGATGAEIVLRNTGDLTITMVDLQTGVQKFGATGNVDIETTGTLNVNAPVLNPGGGDIKLTAGGALTQNDSITASGGNGNIELSAGTEVTLNWFVSTVGTGTITGTTGLTTITATGNVSTVDSTITFNTDDMTIDAAGVIDSGTGTMTIQPVTAGREISLGATLEDVVIYTMEGYIEPENPAVNPWGLSGDGVSATHTDGAPYSLTIVVAANAVDRDTINPGFASFMPLSVTLTINGQTALIVGHDNGNSGGLNLQDNAAGGAFDNVQFDGDVTFLGNSQRIVFDQRVPTSSFALLAVPGTDVPITFSPTTAIQSGAASLSSDYETHAISGSPVTGDSDTQPATGLLTLTDAELDRITAATLTIGNSSAGDVTITDAVNRAAATDVHIISNGSITFSGATGSLDANGGDLTLTTGAAGGVVSGGATTDVNANDLTITAGSGGIGASGNALTTNITTLLTDTSAGNGDQFINEVSGLTDLDLNAGTGDIRLVVGGQVSDSSADGIDVAADGFDLTIAVGASGEFGSGGNFIETNIASLTSSTSNQDRNIYINESDNLTIESINAGQTVFPDIHLIVGGNAVSGAGVILGNALNLTAGGFIDIDTTVSQLNLSTTANGNITVDETNTLSQLNINAGTGDVMIDAGGAVTDGDGNMDIVANDVQIIATSVGVSGSALMTSADTLTVDTSAANGDQFLSESSGLTELDLNAGTGNVVLSAGGGISDGDAGAGVDVTGTTVTLTAPGAGIGIGGSGVAASLEVDATTLIVTAGTGGAFLNTVGIGGVAVTITSSGKAEVRSSSETITLVDINAADDVLVEGTGQNVDAQDVVVTGGGNVTFRTVTSGDITLGKVEAVTDFVEAISAGAILDGVGVVKALEIKLDSATGVGSALSPITTQTEAPDTSTTLSARASISGGVFVSHIGHLEVGTVRSLSDVLGQSDVVLSADWVTVGVARAVQSVAGDIDLTSDEIDINGTVTGSGDLSLVPLTAAAEIKIGFAGDTGAPILDLTDADIAGLIDGFGLITIGKSDAGDVEIDTATFTDPLTIITAGEIHDGSGTDLSAGTNAVTLDGTVAPGQSPGILVVVGNYAFADNSTYEVEIGGTTNTDHDQIDVTGTVTIGTNVTLDVQSWLGFVPAGGHSFIIIENDGMGDDVVGRFVGLLEGAVVDSNFLGSGLSAMISYFGGDGNDVEITVAGFSLSTTSTSSAEGSTDTFSVVLDSPPTSNVVINVVSSDTSVATVNFATLTFTPLNWFMPQIVTVTGVDDTNSPATITLSINDALSDDGFDNLPNQTVSATVTNVVPSVALNANGVSGAVLIIDEQGSAVLTGTITDPGTLDSFIMTVNWGDPLSPDNVQTFTFSPPHVPGGGQRNFTLLHTYLDDNPTATASDNYTVTVTIEDDDQGSLISHWQANNTPDDSFDGNDGTLVNGAGFDPAGQFDEAFLLDGVNDYVSFPRTSLLGGLSFNAWVNTTSADAVSSYAGNAALNVLGDSTNAVYLGFGVEGGVVRYNHYSGGWQSVTGSTVVNDGSWHNIAVTHDQATGAIVIYVDGVADGVGNIPYELTFSAINRIGAGYNNLDAFSGAIDDVTVFNRPLTGPEMAALVNNNVFPGNGVGLSDTETVTVNNVAPIANNDGPGAPYTTNEDTAFITGNILTNDMDPANVFNPLKGVADDILKVVAINGVPAVAGDTVALPSGAILTINADGTLAYDPNNAFFYLAQGQVVLDIFSYTIDDGDSGQSTANVTITVIGNNDIWVDVNNDCIYDPGAGDIDVTSLAEDGTFDARYAEGFYSSPIAGAGIGINALLNVAGNMNFTANGTICVLHSELMAGGKISIASQEQDVVVIDSLITGAAGIALEAKYGSVILKNDLLTTTLIATGTPDADILVFGYFGVKVSEAELTASDRILLATSHSPGHVLANSTVATAAGIQIWAYGNFEATEAILTATDSVMLESRKGTGDISGATLTALDPGGEVIVTTFGSLNAGPGPISTLPVTVAADKNIELTASNGALTIPKGQLSTFSLNGRVSLSSQHSIVAGELDVDTPGTLSILVNSMERHGNFDIDVTAADLNAGSMIIKAQDSVLASGLMATTTTGDLSLLANYGDLNITNAMLTSAANITLNAAQGTLTAVNSNVVATSGSITAIALSNADLSDANWTASASILVSVPGIPSGTGLLQAQNAALTAPAVLISTGVDIQADDIVITAVTEVTIYAYDHDITMLGAQIDATVGTVYVYGHNLDFSPSLVNVNAMINGHGGVTLIAHYGTLTAKDAVITALGPGADVTLWASILILSGAQITANDRLLIDTHYQAGLATDSTIDISLAQLISNTNDVQVRAFGTINAATANIAAVKLVSLYSQYDQISAPGVIIIASEIGAGQIRVESARKLDLKSASLKADYVLAASGGADLDATDAIFSVVGGTSLLDLFALDDLTLIGSIRQHTTQSIRSARGTVHY